MSVNTVILDCYTDEPSGYGVPPYVGTHQLHLSQALAHLGEPHIYLTIDDIRYCQGERQKADADTNKRVRNLTKNAANAVSILKGASTIYIIMGCFVQYSYFSAEPPTSNEVYRILKDTKATKVLFHVMGTIGGGQEFFANSKLRTIIEHFEHGNTYRAVLEGRWSTITENLIAPNYPLLQKISSVPPPILDQINILPLVEIETGTGCNTPTCTFCIESLRSPKVIYREPADVVSQVKAYYDTGVRHFRLGRQPNFYHYKRQDPIALETMLSGIRDSCPDLRVLHIDNVNIYNVVAKEGRRFTELIVKYCTSGNVTPFGVESFDNQVRKATKVIGTADQVLDAVGIVNEFGAERGEDGQPKLLPGINLVAGLPGETSRTHEINLRYLTKILDRGDMTYRLYYRNMAKPTGISFGDLPTKHRAFERNFDEIVSEFVLPMQARVYPKNTVIASDWESMLVGSHRIVRAIGTCSIKIRLQQSARLDQLNQKVKITSNSDYRLLDAVVTTHRNRS